MGNTDVLSSTELPSMHTLHSVQFSCSVVSNSLRPRELQHARSPCPSPTPRVYSNSRPSSQWSHPTISSSIVPFSSCLQSFPASGSFPISQLFKSGGQSIGVSASASALPMNIQDWSPLGWTGWISLLSKGLSRVSSNTTVQNLQFFGTQLSLEKKMATHSSILAWKTPQTEKRGWATDHGVTKSQTQLKWLNTHTKTAFFIVQLSYPYMTTGKTIALTRQTFVSKVMSLLCLFIQYQKMCYLLTLCCVVLSCSFVSYSLQPHRLFTTRLLCPWKFSGKNTGVVCDFFLQGIFLTEGSNLSFLCLLHWRIDSLSLFQIRKCL